MRVRYIALMGLLATTLLRAPTASACSLNPTAIISAPAASSSHIHGTGVSFVGTSSTANCGWISAYIWRNGVTILSYSSSFPYNVTLEPEQVDSVITVSLQVINSYGRSHTVNRTITIKRDHQSQYFVKDHLGSPRVVVDGKGTVLSYTDYYPFGMVMPGRAGNISLTNDRVKFTGYLLEEEGGQDTYHAEARGYDPVIGRFTSRDPITQVLNPKDLFKVHGGKHLWYSTYAYAFNNPVNLFDPSGLSPEDPEKLTKAAQVGVDTATKMVGNTTDAACNYGVAAAFKEVTGSSELDGLNANGIMDAVSKPDGDFVKVDKVEDVQALANAGEVVIGGIKKANGASGHVVMAVPGKSHPTGRFNGSAPSVMDTGRNMRSTSQSAANSFNKTDSPSVVFYVHQPKNRVYSGGSLPTVTVTASGTPGPNLPRVGIR